MKANNFTPGQQVIIDGTLYTFKHYATAQGTPPRTAPGASAPAHCSYAVVDLPDGTNPILVRHKSLKTPSDVAVDKMVGPSVEVASQVVPTWIDIIKADALDAQASRLDDYAKSLRAEAQALRSIAVRDLSASSV